MQLMILSPYDKSAEGTKRPFICFSFEKKSLGLFGERDGNRSDQSNGEKGTETHTHIAVVSVQRSFQSISATINSNTRSLSTPHSATSPYLPNPTVVLNSTAPPTYASLWQRLFSSSSSSSLCHTSPPSCPAPNEAPKLC